MNIIFNHDGSIKNLNLNEIIVQGNNLVNEIQIAIEGRTPDDYVATAYFTLPDGTSNYLTGSADNFSIDQTPYSGYSINLTSAQTVMAGEVGMTIQCTDANSHVLCTYKVKLTINESGYIPEATTITMAQYASIIASLATFQQKFVTSNARYYPSYDDAEEDLENFATNQLAIVGGDSTPLAFYFKNGSGNLQKISTEFFGYIELRGTDGTLTSAQIRELQKDFCIINREGTYFFKTEDAYAFEQEYIAFRTIPFFDSSDLIYADKKQQTIEVYPDEGYEWVLTEKDIYEGMVFQATELEPEEAITSIDEFLAECASYNSDFSANDGHRYHYSYTNPITHNTTDYFAEFLGGDYSALVRVRSRVGAVKQTDKVYYCAYNTSSNEWEIFELASKAYVDEEAYGYVQIIDGSNARSGSITSDQKDQIAKKLCIIEYVNSTGNPLCFVPTMADNADAASLTTRDFVCVIGWENSSSSALAKTFKQYGIRVDHLDYETAAWELADLSYSADKVPTDNSNNLITSNGVYDAIASAKSTIEGEISSLTRTLIHKDDYSTSSTSFDAYGVAPKALPKASLDGFLGNSVVRNQQFNITATTTTIDGITFTVNADKSVTLSGTATAAITFPLTGSNVKLVSGHKYILIGGYSNDIFIDNTYTSYIEGKSPYVICDCPTTISLAQFRIRVANGTAISGSIRVYPILIDLTQWFGATANIPADLLSTPSLFLSKYAYGMDLSFNTGTLVDGTLTKLTANPFNVWDEEWEVGLIKETDGTNENNSNAIRSKNFTKVIPNADYYFRIPLGTSNWIRVCWYDKDQNFISGLQTTTLTQKSPTNASYVRFSTNATYGSTYHNDICINVSNADLNGTYLPHANPIETPLSIGTMRSVGSVRDTDELTKVGAYNLGDADWEYYLVGSLSKSFMRAQISGRALTKNVLCGKFFNNTYASGAGDLSNNEMFVSTANTYIYIEQNQYTDATAFKNSLNGVYLNYELATPTARTTTFPEIIDIHSGGVIEAEFTDLPITTQITYLEEE